MQVERESFCFPAPGHLLTRTNSMFSTDSPLRLVRLSLRINFNPENRRSTETYRCNYSKKHFERIILYEKEKRLELPELQGSI